MNFSSIKSVFGRLRLRRCAKVYFILLAASFVWQWIVPGWASRDATDSVIEVAPQSSDGPIVGRPVDMAYLESGAETGGETIILLHGSPGSASNLRKLQANLDDRFHVISFDLPGFGDSTRWVPDYSISAHARYLLDAMDTLHIDKAHVVGFSMGGGVALSLVDLAPERVSSVVMLSSIGLQEGEGSGDYHFEHLKYTLGYGLVVALPELVPHFGMFGDRSFRHAFIRNFYDTDQRPLREIIETMDTPALVLHGRHDPLVPAWLAEKHHEMVEQSELVMFDSDHFMVFRAAESAQLADEITGFIDRVNQYACSTLPRRTIDHSEGSLEPAQAMTIPAPFDLDRSVGPWLQMVALALATFASEDLTCIAAGLLVHQGQLGWLVAIVGCWFGIFVGDIGLWALGHFFGKRVLLKWTWLSRKLPVARLERTGDWLDSNAAKAVIVARFVPGTRLPIYFAAGMLGRRALPFLIWFAVAAFLWVPLIVVAAAVLGKAAIKPFEYLVGPGWVSFLFAALVVFVVLRLLEMCTTTIGRAKIGTAFRRVIKYEFWPAYVFYLPLVPWIILLSLKYRGFGTITAANPNMPEGGFVGESKFDILKRLPEDYVLPSQLIEPDENVDTRFQDLQTKMADRGWCYPIVLKPDVGERGSGVRLVRSEDDARTYIEKCADPIVAQIFHPGPYEAGIFYYRYPHARRGRIFSITDKQFQYLEGDGESTIEQLIWRHERYRMQASVFTSRHADRLGDVLDRGERLRLTVAGNHCQGTMFLDGRQLITPKLERAIDKIAKDYDGFYFGRFDVRYEDVEEFKQGRGFSIVELNGVSSESTNIYDPTRGISFAYKTLFRQWAMLFRIGDANRKRGHGAATHSTILRLLYRHYFKRDWKVVSD
jgi:pimeloyl-ACP methyl ester carboxylesterase/membrane protein DedA with SNARE-associated domain